MTDDLIENLAGVISRECGVHTVWVADILRAELGPALEKAEAMDALTAIGAKQAVGLENLRTGRWRFEKWGFSDKYGRIASCEWFGATPAEAIKAAAAAGKEGAT
jgi:hypothetical protein